MELNICFNRQKIPRKSSAMAGHTLSKDFHFSLILRLMLCQDVFLHDSISNTKYSLYKNQYLQLVYVLICDIS